MDAKTFYESKSLAEKQKLGWMNLDVPSVDWFLIMEAYAKRETRRANANKEAWTVARAKLQDLEKVLGLDNPYPLKDVLHKLKSATKYLLEEKSYDGHDYEELEQCVKRASEIINHIKNK